MKIKSLIVAVSILGIIPISVDASSKYYKYYLKARPADILWGRVGDHTYVCIKKKKKKHHKYKTIRNYGCHTVFGEIYSDARTVQTWKVKKNSWSKRMKDASIKVTKAWQCDKYRSHGRYGLSVVCHQTANRMLYAVPGHPTLDGRINGYYNLPVQSRWQYGKYGKFGWSACRKATYGW